MTTYKMVELKDGEPVQYLGVYVTRWTSEMGEPTVGFVEDDEVEILRARVAELEAAQRWIPVTERLPEEGQLVVVFTPINVGDNFRYETLVWRSRYAKYVNNHLWMPLPQPPEVK